MARLSGKIAIVTGAASGIGKAAFDLFRAEGATVVGADVSEGADHLVDAGREGDVKALVERIAGEHGGLDIFFANAGISGGWATIAEQSEQDWAEILRVNLIGPFLAIKYAAPLISQRGGGSIVCTASVAGLRSGAGGAAYSASKAGVINLVQTAAQQLAGSGVRVNAICPGVIDTSRMDDLGREDVWDQLVATRIPLGRAGTGDDIAHTVVYLCSDQGAWVTGQSWNVDGGTVVQH